MTKPVSRLSTRRPIIFVVFTRTKVVKSKSLLRKKMYKNDKVCYQCYQLADEHFGKKINLGRPQHFKLVSASNGGVTAWRKNCPKLQILPPGRKLLVIGKRGSRLERICLFSWQTSSGCQRVTAEAVITILLFAQQIIGNWNFIIELQTKQK